LAVEEPLQIRVLGDPIATTMRTPGHDHELVAGFLFAEGLIRSERDLGSLAPCGRPGEDGYGNVIDVTPGPGTAFDFESIERTHRTGWTSAACGVCGRRSIDDLLARCGHIEDRASVEASLLLGLTAGLREKQQNFAYTGGLHAAALVSVQGEYRIVREDIGRHNAVDKVVGRLLLDEGLPGAGSILVVSGRSSFEIVQKTVAAQIPILVSVSAPSSLAVATAARAGLTLVGFARDSGFNVYSGRERIV
ncbi:MAG TPA: formate dehydrogenase accessory sulfurtransferase FdhD, partial [Polyangiaceae bacterium]|nr:formate dehydrogenase accessory sulfurtransferase FdhD [Polyangiaceae bacterium]